MEMTDRFLPGVPGPEIERIFNAAAGNEIESGKFDNPESSAASGCQRLRILPQAAPATYRPCRIAAGWYGLPVRWRSKRRFASPGAPDAIPCWIVS